MLKFIPGTASTRLVFVVLPLLGKFNCTAAPVGMPVASLSWNASQDPSVAGYAIYYGTNSGSYSMRIDAGTNTTDSITNLTPGTEYYFSVTSYNAAGIESTPSNQIAVTAPTLLQLEMSNPTAGATLGFIALAGHWYQLQVTSDLKNWSNLWQSAVASQMIWTTYQDNFPGNIAGQRFYRLVIH